LGLPQSKSHGAFEAYLKSCAEEGDGVGAEQPYAEPQKFVAAALYKGAIEKNRNRATAKKNEPHQTSVLPSLMLNVRSWLRFKLCF